MRGCATIATPTPPLAALAGYISLLAGQQGEKERARKYTAGGGRFKVGGAMCPGVCQSAMAPPPSLPRRRYAAVPRPPMPAVSDLRLSFLFFPFFSFLSLSWGRGGDHSGRRVSARLAGALSMVDGRSVMRPPASRYGADGAVYFSK